MTIDTGGTWWIGSEATDIDEYLRAYTADGYPVGEFRLCRCDCGSIRFRFEYHAVEGVARRTCAACGVRRFIADSHEHAKGVRLQKLKCGECPSDVFNVGVGFSFRDDRQSVRWVTVGERCAECGVLGSCVDWKINYEPSLPLLDQC